MSFTFEIKGHATSRWPLSSACVGQVERLRLGAGHDAIALVFGVKNTQAGETRLVRHDALLQSVEYLLLLAKDISGGFCICTSDDPFDGHSRAVTARINGEDYIVECRDDYWRQMKKTDAMAVLKGEIEPAQHHEPATIASDNRGIIKIESKKRKTNDLIKLLRDVKNSLFKETEKELYITWG